MGLSSCVYTTRWDPGVSVSLCGSQEKRKKTFMREDKDDGVDKDSDWLLERTEKNVSAIQAKGK